MNKTQLPIGIFDSGLGGLTVLKALQRALPKESFIYVGDTAHVPYGNKSLEAIIIYSKRIAKFLINQKVKLIIIACNTSSALALKALKQTFDLPILDVITPVQKIISLKSTPIKIGVIGTHNTIASGAYRKAIKPKNKKIQIFEQACPLFVPIIEEGLQNDSIASLAVKKYLTPLINKNIQLLILGCTHYPLIKETIQRNIPKKIQIVDSANSMAEYLTNYLNKTRLLSHIKRKKDRIIITDHSDNFHNFTNKILDRNDINIEILKLT